MATAAQWIEGARLRTLPLAVAPIIALTSENGKAITARQMLLYPLKKQVGSALH